MKKIILTVAAVFALTFANAQDKKNGFAKGDMYVGGTISYSSEDNDGDKTTSTTLAPEFGYFISDDLALTAGISMMNQDNGTNKPSSFNMNLGGKYYFLNIGDNFKTYTHFGLTFGSIDLDNGSDKISTMGLGAGVGFNYFITSNLAIDMGLGDVLSYGNAKQGDAKYTSTSLNVNVFDNFFNTPTFGMIYKF